MPLTPYGINCSLVPTGAGWWFPQPFNGETQRIPAAGCAGSAEKLCEEVRMFRIRHGIPLGAYKHEIAAHIAKISPLNRFSRRKEITPPNRTFDENTPISTRLVQWLGDVASKGPRVVGSEEASTRFEVCAKCPINKPITATGESLNEIRFRRASVRQRVIYHHDAELGVCKASSIDLPSAVFLDRDFLPLKTSEHPPHCWLPRP